MAKRVRWVVAVILAAGLGVAAGVVLARSPSPRARFVSAANSRVASPRTVTEVRTVVQVHTTVKTAPAPRSTPPSHGPVGTVNAPSNEASGASAAASGGLTRPQEFSGVGPHVLGTIVVGEPGGTLRWTNSGGVFRLLFNGSGVAVNSTAPNGQIAAPPFTYQQVTVDTPGRWTIQIS